jgi:hypothetical protein
VAISVRPATDAACCEWLRVGLRSWGKEQGTSVGAIVPPDLGAFARLRKAEGDTLSLEQASLLVGVLDGHEPAQTMYFAVWEGYGGLAEVVPPSTPRFKMPQRVYFLFQGEPADLGRFEWDGGYYFAPDIWWPDHRRWCVGSDTDLGHVYVGGSASMIEALVRHPGLGAEATDADYRIDLDPDAGV